MVRTAIVALTLFAISIFAGCSGGPSGAPVPPAPGVAQSGQVQASARKSTDWGGPGTFAVLTKATPAPTGTAAPCYYCW